MTDIQSDIALQNKIGTIINTPITNSKPKLSKFTKLNNEHFIFLNSLQFALDHNSNIHEFINKYWRHAFPEKPFPERRTLQELKVAIQYGLVLNAHVENKVKPTEKFLENCRRSTEFNQTEKLTGYLDRCESFNSLSKIIIFPITLALERIDASEEAPAKKKKAKTK